MAKQVSEETRNRQSRAAKIRWDPVARQQSVFDKIHKILSGYYADHPDRTHFTKEHAYAILSAMEFRTARPTSPGRDFFDGTEELLP